MMKAPKIIQATTKAGFQLPTNDPAPLSIGMFSTGCVGTATPPVPVAEAAAVVLDPHPPVCVVVPFQYPEVDVDQPTEPVPAVDPVEVQWQSV